MNNRKRIPTKRQHLIEQENSRELQEKYSVLYERYSKQHGESWQWQPSIRDEYLAEAQVIKAKVLGVTK